MTTTTQQLVTSLRTVSTLQLALDPIRDTQAIFRTALNALSWPGSIQQLPAAAGAPANPWAAGLLITLLDHETTLAVEPFPDAEALEVFVRQRTSAGDAQAVEADFILAFAETIDPELPLRVKHGSLEYPDDGATIVVAVQSLDQHAQSGARLKLDGPGVPEGHELRVTDLPVEFFEARAEVARHYPCGVDTILVDAEGRLTALPRSARITVVEEGS